MRNPLREARFDQIERWLGRTSKIRTALSRVAEGGCGRYAHAEVGYAENANWLSSCAPGVCDHQETLNIMSSVGGIRPEMRNENMRAGRYGVHGRAKLARED
jgi:hypothetical protein